MLDRVLVWGQEDVSKDLLGGPQGPREGKGFEVNTQFRVYVYIRVDCLPTPPSLPASSAPHVCIPLPSFLQPICPALHLTLAQAL